MLSYIWSNFLYQPLFNALIWIYLNIAGRNLGWAVVWLTILLRIFLLPLTIISEHDAIKQKKVEEEARLAAKAYKNDTVAQKEEIRKIMRKNRVSPWAKVMSLGLQLLVLILLYQVFIRGITGERVVKILYPWIDFPGKINTDFYGFNIGNRHEIIWAGAAALYLFVSIFLKEGVSRKKDSSKNTFLFLFPLITLALLWYLPMVKSLFILTTMIFSDIISFIKNLIFADKDKEKEKQIAEAVPAKK
ncbi:MAG TPA: YidC/Oxa1 family membrane protein insertase [Candidatus Udaeobacter sp.]|nr:YidC/Oxa1 family membrane protein insertase [Candidatus Udaeobacter sp.]